MPDFPRLRKVFESLSGPDIRVNSLVLKEGQMKLLTKKAAVATLMAGLAAVSFAGCNRGTAAPEPGGEATGGATGAAAGKRACIILPDAASSRPRA
jgi:hypothetical protein